MADVVANDIVYVLKLVTINGDGVGQAWAVSRMAASGTPDPMALRAVD